MSKDIKKKREEWHAILLVDKNISLLFWGGYVCRDRFLPNRRTPISCSYFPYYSLILPCCDPSHILLCHILFGKKGVKRMIVIVYFFGKALQAAKTHRRF